MVLVPDVPTLGEIIRDWRKARSMSQAALARAAGIESQTISNIETGRTQFLQSEQFAKVAAAMGKTTQELTGEITRWEIAAAAPSTLELDVQTAGKLKQVADAAGKDPIDWLADVIDEHLGRPTTKSAAVPAKKRGRPKLRPENGILTELPDPTPQPLPNGTPSPPPQQPPPGRSFGPGERADG